MPVSFVDTNIVVYIASGDDHKADRAERVLAEGAAVSVQVLNEIANVARRKMRLSWPETNAFLSLVRAAVTVHPMTVETHETGLRLAERYGLSIYDSMIASSALNAGCEVLWSEDMQHGLTIEGRLRILNPFKNEPELA